MAVVSAAACDGPVGSGASPATSTAKNTMNDQNNGDLFPLLEQLREVFPADGSVMPIVDLLEYLKKARCEVFQSVEQLSVAARHVSGLSEAAASQWKAKGNKEFAEGQLQSCVLAYTNGLLCAELESTLATLLNNRSTAFFKLRRYADACVDANRSLQYKPDYWKALQRRGRCLEELGFADLGKKDVQAALDESLVSANDDAAMRRVFGDVASGMADSALPPRATVSSHVKVERSAKGRGLIAKMRLECGQVLEETPYAHVARMEALLSVCSYCLQYTTCLYHGEAYRQAGRKSRGFFCSEHCAAASWEHYGKDESRHPFFLCCPNDLLLAYRVIRGMETYPQLASLEAASDFDEVSHNAFGSSHVRTLEGHWSKEMNGSAAWGGYESIVAALGLHMGAFTAAEAERLRKIQRQILLNACEVTCLIRTVAPSASAQSDFVHSNTGVVLGKGLYPITTLFNHSCDPNCFVSFVGGPQGSSAKLVVRAIRPVMEGEELTIAYGGISRFHFHSLRNRLQTIKYRYGFFCHCNACARQVDEPVRDSDKEHYIKASDYYQKGRRLIREGDCETAVTVLLQSYEIVMRYICPPPHPPQMMIPKTHDALALAYFHLRNREKCLEHLRAALEVDIELHGTDNRVELINDYTRLAFASITVEETRKYANKALELLRRFYAASSMLDIQAAYIESSLQKTPEATPATK